MNTLEEATVLPLDELNNLSHHFVSMVEPYSLMIAPVYIAMPLNKKLVSVKAPFDFFTKEELVQFEKYQKFYMPKYSQQADPLRVAGKLVKSILGKLKERDLVPAPFEISKEIFKICSPLWGQSIQIEIRFLSAFSDELCAKLDTELLKIARETDLALHEEGIQVSGMLAFLMVQLGFFELNQISKWRTCAYQCITQGSAPINPQFKYLLKDLRSIFEMDRVINEKSLSALRGEWAQKLLARLHMAKGRT